MSYAQARADIAGAVAAAVAAWTAYPLVVEMDNRNVVNYDTQQKPFLQVDTYYLDGEQLDMAANPMVAQYGQILLSVVSKEGTGVSESALLVDFLIPYFELKEFAVVRTNAAKPQKSKPLRGWHYQPILVPFWFVRVT